MLPCIVINFLKENQLDALISQIYYWNETLHVSDSSSVHHLEFFIVHTANLYGIPLLCVQWKTPDDGQRNCPKRVEFHPKNKFEKLVHLVGCTKRNHMYFTQNEAVSHIRLGFVPQKKKPTTIRNPATQWTKIILYIKFQNCGQQKR